MPEQRPRQLGSRDEQVTAAFRSSRAAVPAAMTIEQGAHNGEVIAGCSQFRVESEMCERSDIAWMCSRGEEVRDQSGTRFGFVVVVSKLPGSLRQHLARRAEVVMDQPVVHAGTGG